MQNNALRQDRYPAEFPQLLQVVFEGLFFVYFKRALSQTMAAVLLTGFAGCATATVTPAHEDYYESREGRIPFVLRFPAGVPAIDGKKAASLQKKRDADVIDKWTLARYYHTASDNREEVRLVYEIYSSFPKNDEHHAMARNNLACMTADAGDYAESERIFKELIGLSPPLIDAFYNLYILYKLGGRTADGVKVLLLMNERYPMNIFALIELGDLFLEKDDYAMAEKFYSKALAAQEDNPVPVYRMARVREMQKKYDEAERYYEQCIASFPYFHYAYLDYSRLLLTLDKNEKAREVLMKGTKIMKKQQR
jgi:tetratricopeptide (TPR) repeat protein